VRGSGCSVQKAVLRALACVAGLLLIAPDAAAAEPATFNIAAQPLPNALKAFAAQSKMQLLYRYDWVSHAMASPVLGKLEKHAALEQLLRGTGLEVVYSNEHIATIRPPGAEIDPPPRMTSDDQTGSSNPVPSGPAVTAKTHENGRLPRAAGGAGGGLQDGRSTDFEEPRPLQEVVVVGVKQAISTSQQIKKVAPTFVDSVTATDIGAFPDKSASESLQRLPGVNVNRLQSNDDSTHPSGEPTNILIRGLSQVRTELNGRDTFSADSGRGLNFNDISPELLSRADAYKNQTADMIDGGIAGTVDMRTRLPFDQDGHVLVASVQGD